VGTHRDKAQERIKIEAAQGADMATRTQVTLRKEGLGCQRETNGKRRCQERERRARRIKPDDPRRGQGQFKGRPHELATETGEEAERLHTVAALGHVRGQPTVEIAVAEAGNFLQERYAQAGLQVAPEAQEP
jgi:hypothetical protein